MDKKQQEKLKEILSKIEPLLDELDKLTGKDHSLLNHENIRRMREEVRIEIRDKLFQIFSHAEDTIWLNEHTTFMDALISDDIITQMEYEAWMQKNPQPQKEE